MKKFAVVDTNIWLLAPRFYEQYKEYVIVIPQTVVEELDKKKTAYGMLGINARMSCRKIGEISDAYQNEHENDIITDSEGYRFILHDLVIRDKEELSSVLDLSVNDNKIIGSALVLSSENKETVVLSNDCNVRSKLGFLYKEYGVKGIQYDDGKDVAIGEYYTLCKPNITNEQLANLYSHKLKVSDICEIKTSYKNMPIYFNTVDGDEILAVVKRDGVSIEAIEEGNKKKRNPYNVRKIKPVNGAQVQLVRAIQDSNVKVVACMGRTGSGKSLIAVAAAFQQYDIGAYSHIKLIKPYSPMGNTVGMLKGSYEDKVAPIRGSYEGVLDLIGVEYEKASAMGIVKFDVPEFERGKTYHSTLVIVDEAQNMTPHEVKSLVTRCGESSKIILLGDNRQQDSLYLTESYNGLANTIDKLTDQEFFSVIYLDKSERAEFLNIVDDLL